jgi:hypothetical protein
MKKIMRRGVAGLAFVGILLTSSCGLRYKMQKPPQLKKNVVSPSSLRLFRSKEPLPDLPLPKALEKNLGPRFITFDSECKPGDLLWLKSKEQ